MPATLTDVYFGIFSGKIKFLLNIGLFAYKLNHDESKQTIFQGIYDYKIRGHSRGFTDFVYIYHDCKA